MRMLLFFATLATLQILIDASHPFYYFGQPNFYHHAPAVPSFNSYSHRHTSSYFGNPHFFYRTVPTPIIPQVRIPVPTTPAPYVPQKNDYSQYNEDGEYRGFAYQTRTDNGATSHVLFVTGPQSEMFKSAILPPKMQDSTMNDNQNEDMNSAKTIAFNMVDKIGEKVPQTNFYNIAPQPVPQNPTQFFQDFLQQNQIPRTVHFYSRNSKLFVQPAIGYPANTGPLLQPNESRYYSSFINPRINPITTTDKATEIPAAVTSTKFEEKSDNEVAQESIISQTRFRLNQITENPKTFTPQTTDEVTSSNFAIEQLPFGTRLSSRINEKLDKKETETTEATKTTLSSLETQSTEGTTQAIIETTVVNTPKIESELITRNSPVSETTVNNLPTIETEATIADSLASETATRTTIANSPASETTSIAANTPAMETVASSAITTAASETTLPTISIETTSMSRIETTVASTITTAANETTLPTIPVETTSASRIETTVANSPAIETTTAAILANAEENETTSTANTGTSATETVSTIGSISTGTMTETTANTQEEMTGTSFTSAVTMTTETENTTTKI